MAGYTELQVCSNYSFLRGASRIEKLMLQAKALGYDALAVTDHNKLAGIARAHARAREVGIRLVVGCRLELTDSLPMLAYPTDRPAYARLCRLLTVAKSRGGKGTFELSWAELRREAKACCLSFCRTCRTTATPVAPCCSICLASFTNAAVWRSRPI